MQKERPWLWWTMLAVLVAAHVGPHVYLDDAKGGGPGGGRETLIMSRYLVGLHDLSPEGGEGLFRRIEGTARSTADRIRLVPVEAELVGKPAARARLETLEADGAYAADLETLRAVYGEEPRLPSPEQREELRRRHGWFAELALSHAPGATAHAREVALEPAKRTALTLTAATLLGLVAFAAGIALAIRWGVRRARGTWTDALHPTPRRPGDTVLLETVVVFLLALLVLDLFLPLLLVGVAGLRPGPWLHLLPWLALPVLAWPRLRGIDAARWRRDLGLHRGEGLLREAGRGVLGYLAALPLLGAGFLASAWLAGALGRDPSHPLVEEATRGSPGQLASLYAMACLWAPLAEEAAFRGALYRYLRGRWGVLASGLLVALVFAALHPQGVAGIPVLASIALALALIREWRGSLVAPVTAHALHNGVFLTLAVLVTR